MAATFTVRISTDRGVSLYETKPPTLTPSLEYVRTVNQPGRFSIVLEARDLVGTAAVPGSPYPIPGVPLQLRPDLLIAVARAPSHEPLAVGTPTWMTPPVPYPLRLEGVFLLKEWTWFTDDFGNDRVVISGPDMLNLLNDRIVTGVPNSDEGTKTGPADDVMKAFVRESLGPLATNINRRLDPNHWSVAPDQSLGPTITITGSKQPLLDVCEDCAEASRLAGMSLYFDIVARTPVAYQFRTYPYQRGADRSWPGAGQVVLSSERGSAAFPRAPSLRKPEQTEDWDEEWNKVYTTGVGPGIDEIVLRSSDDSGTRAAKSIWGRREYWKDTRSTATTEGVAAAGYAALSEGRPRKRFSAQIADVHSARYGIDFACGDRLAAQYRGAVYRVMVNAVQVKVDAKGQETVTIHVAAGNDW